MDILERSWKNPNQDLAKILPRIARCHGKILSERASFRKKNLSPDDRSCPDENRNDRILCFVFRSEEDSILLLLKQAFIAHISCFSNVV